MSISGDWWNRFVPTSPDWWMIQSGPDYWYQTFGPDTNTGIGYMDIGSEFMVGLVALGSFEVGTTFIVG